MQEVGQGKPTNVRALRELEHAFHGAYPPEGNTGRSELRTRPPNEDWVATLVLVEKAAEAFQVAHQRIKELEERGGEIVRVTRAQLQNAKANVKAAEARASEAEQRANDAEELAREPREWLTRIHEELEQLPLPA